MKTDSVTIGLPVADLGAAARWYAQLLGGAREVEPVEGIRELEVHGGCWLQLFEGNGGSGEAILRLGVSDVRAARARLVAAGIQVGEIEQVEGVIAFCEFTDPWGNALSLYEEF